MKTLATVLALLCSLCVLARPASARQEDGPEQVVDALFAAMKAGDADAMRALLHPDARLVSTSVRDGSPVVEVVAVDGWLAGVAASTRELDERIYDVRTLVDQGLATVWARYDIYVDGVHHHCGVDAFQLVRTAGGWRILDIADTRSTEGCRGA